MTKSDEATAVAASETFEEFYEREFLAVVGLAYALSGTDRARRTLRRKLSSSRTVTGIGSGPTPGRTSGFVGWSRTSPSRSSGVAR